MRRGGRRWRAGDGRLTGNGAALHRRRALHGVHGRPGAGHREPGARRGAVRRATGPGRGAARTGGVVRVPRVPGSGCSRVPGGRRVGVRGVGAVRTGRPASGARPCGGRVAVAARRGPARGGRTVGGPRRRCTAHRALHRQRRAVPGGLGTGGLRTAPGERHDERRALRRNRRGSRERLRPGGVEREGPLAEQCPGRPRRRSRGRGQRHRRGPPRGRLHRGGGRARGRRTPLSPAAGPARCAAGSRRVRGGACRVPRPRPGRTAAGPPGTGGTAGEPTGGPLPGRTGRRGRAVGCTALDRGPAGGRRCRAGCGRGGRQRGQRRTDARATRPGPASPGARWLAFSPGRGGPPVPGHLVRTGVPRPGRPGSGGPATGPGRPPRRFLRLRLRGIARLRGLLYGRRGVPAHHGQRGGRLRSGGAAGAGRGCRYGAGRQRAQRRAQTGPHPARPTGPVRGPLRDPVPGLVRVPVPRRGPYGSVRGGALDGRFRSPGPARWWGVRRSPSGGFRERIAVGRGGAPRPGAGREVAGVLRTVRPEGDECPQRHGRAPGHDQRGPGADGTHSGRPYRPRTARRPGARAPRTRRPGARVPGARVPEALAAGARCTELARPGAPVGRARRPGTVPSRTPGIRALVGGTRRPGPVVAGVVRATGGAGAAGAVGACTCTCARARRSGAPGALAGTCDAGTLVPGTGGTGSCMAGAGTRGSRPRRAGTRGSRPRGARSGASGSGGGPGAPGAGPRTGPRCAPLPRRTARPRHARAPGAGLNHRTLHNRCGLRPLRGGGVRARGGAHGAQEQWCAPG